MRNEVVDFLVKKTSVAGNDIVFLTGDLGFSVLEPLREKLGNRFINVGIAESLMTTIAASFATYGYKTFTYSITPFATLRCLEQIRNDVCYHQQDVTVIGIGAGFGYGALGPTHHAIEDLAAVWSIPYIQVYNPADVNEAYACFQHSWESKGPKYLRLSKGGDGYLSQTPLNDFKTSKIVEYSKGSDLTIISTGNILSELLKATLQIENKNIQILSCPILKPFPSSELVEKITSKHIIVIEELAPYGGFSGECAKAILKADQLNIKSFETLSATDEFSKTVGSCDFQRKNVGLDCDNIKKRILNILAN